MQEKWVLPGKTLIMGLSSYCQARCIMCPFEEYPYKNSNMDYGLFVKCIDEGSEHGLENLDMCLMGDSLLDPGIKEKMNYLKLNYPYINTYASSQGMSVDVDFVCKYIDTLHISFYGTTKEVYEGVHGGGVRYETALENVERLLLYPKDQRPYVILTFLVLPSNEHQLEDWLHKWEPISDEVIVWRPHNWGGRYKGDCPNMENLSSRKSCGRPASGPLSIWVNGDVTPCCFNWDERMIIGNVKNDSLEDILISAERKRIISIHESGHFDKCGIPCEYCDQLLDREDALVYSNHDRMIGGSIYGDDIVVRFME